MINIKFELSHEDAVIPYKAHKGDLGLDVYPAFDFDYKEIEPGETELIPTGIKTSFSDRYGVILKERSGLASKGIKVSAGVIDSGYRGEWKVAIYNTTNKPVLIAKYPEDFDEEVAHIINYNNAIAQAVIVPSVQVTEEIVDDVEDTERSSKGFGSTDNQ